MALDRGALSADNRQTCQNIREKLIDAMRAHGSTRTDYSGHRNEITRLEREIRQLESELITVDEHKKSSISTKICMLRNNLDFHFNALNQLDRRLSSYDQEINQLSNEFSNNACHQFFSNPADQHSPVPSF